MKERATNHPGELSTRSDIVERTRPLGELNARVDALKMLSRAGVPFMVGGAYAYCAYTGIYRDTKDLDLFLRKADAERALEVFEEHGWRTDRDEEDWVFKGYRGEWFIDLIFSSGNGVAVVDDVWLAHATRGEVMGCEVLLTPPEEMLWSKAFVLERERYDGADVVHLIRALGHALDWDRLLTRFDRYWEVLLSHLLLFHFAFPSERQKVPDWLMTELTKRTLQGVHQGNWSRRICRGNLISRVNYELDIKQWGYDDGRKWDERNRAEGDMGGEGSDLQDSHRSGG